MRAAILSSALLFWLGVMTSSGRVRQGNEPKSVVIRAGVAGNYSSTFSIGSQASQTNLVLSMQQDWSYVMTANCSNCPSKPYNYSKSTTFNKSDHEMNQIVLGTEDNSVTLFGFVAQDRLCALSVIAPANQSN